MNAKKIMLEIGKPVWRISYREVSQDVDLQNKPKAANRTMRSAPPGGDGFYR
jgi:hypothetical protein